MHRLTALFVALLATAFARAHAAPPSPADAAESMPAAAASAAVAAPTADTTTTDTSSCRCVPAGAVVDLRIEETLNSSAHKRGDRFVLRLSEPIVVAGETLIPAETPGVGEVVHAAAARGGGKPGELLLAARYLEYEGRQIPLRGLKLGVSGKDNAELALAVSFAAGPFAMFIRGREIEVPAGTRVHAKVSALFDPDAQPAPATETLPSQTE